MSTPISHQENWYDLCGILRKYLLTSSVPFLFRELYNSEEKSRQLCELYNNEEKSRQLCNKEEFITFLKNNYNESNDKGYTNYSNPTFNETWASLFRQAITDTFMQRLLGSQSDMETYRARSTKYLKTLNNMFGTHNGDEDMSNITISFFELLKDYICRNLPGLFDDVKEQSPDRVMSACRKIYAGHRFRNSNSRDVNPFYIPFDRRAFSSSLLTLIDEISVDMEKHPLTRHYLVVAEYIHTLFIYVYMIEFVKFYPSDKDKNRLKSTVIEHDRNNNLFIWLSQMNFIKVYNEIKNSKKKSSKKSGKKNVPKDND